MINNIEVVPTEADFDNFINRNENKVIIIHFGATWAVQCKQINDILKEFVDQQDKFSFLYVEAEKFPRLALKYKITAVPTLVFVKRNQIIKVIQGLNPKDLYKTIKDISNKSVSPVQIEDISVQLKKLINASPVMLFMKGSPNEPKCGFSRKIVSMLNDCEAVFQTFDILTNAEVREELKRFSNWPTYPQLYIKGELIGGLDICQELFDSGDLSKLIKEALQQNKINSENSLKDLVSKEKVMLFMKGTPDSPKCGFSRNCVDILKRSGIKFGYFDILSNEEVRQGLKTLFNWPTYPQLYVNGELIGGFDIIKELDLSKELVTTCN